MEIFFYIEIISHLYIKIQSLTSNTNYEEFHTKQTKNICIWIRFSREEKKKKTHNDFNYS